MELAQKTVAILAADDYEDIELFYTYYRMQEASAAVKIIGTVMSSDTLRGKHGYAIPINLRANEAKPEAFDAIIIPGGWAPDRLTWCTATMDFVRRAFEQGKILSAISQGSWVLSSANVLKGRNATSDPIMRNNIKNAGANWIDEEVVVDNNIITSRTSRDLPAFCRELIRVLAI